ncbi:MAG: hypothetical protein QY320_13025 [Gammaproteobacteria bacterium]|nr:MAG: hypothetical protein QY320_13025 [Gammaproteobacteria bacterium]
MKSCAFRPIIVLLAGLVLASCGTFRSAPGSSVVQFHNNSGRTILVENSELLPGRTATFKYPTDSGRPLIVFWHGCVHTYIAPERKPGEFRGTDWMLRGAYRAQLEPDGSLYLVPPGAALPTDVAVTTQPEGFPLRPREGSSCVQ